MARLLRISVFVAVLLTVTPATWGVDYKAVILNPSGWVYSKAMDISADRQVGVGYGIDVGGALIWSGTPDSVVVLDPAGQAEAISGTQVVGRRGGHAALWSTTGGAVVDLHPSGYYSESGALDTSGTKQVGYCSVDSAISHAVLWSGSAQSVVDLHPVGFVSSSARAISGGRQIGTGLTNAASPGGGHVHALLWSGSPESCVDLNPGGSTSSRGYGMDESNQVGVADNHAILWSGTAENYVDLHPSSGFSETTATNVSGGRQVGVGAIPGGLHALLWSGTADSVVDLHSYLPPGYYQSIAWGISATGNIVGEAWITTGNSGDTEIHAVMWVPLIYVEIDIKPGSYPNSINLGNEGVIPVAILSSWEFDATTVDPATVELEGAGVELRGKSDKAMAHREDVNKDGRIDLVVQITTQNLDPGAFQDGYATLTGKTYAGLFIEGADEIIIVPK